MISRIDSLGNYRKHYQLKMQKHDNSQRDVYKRQVSVEIAGEEGKEAPKGRRKSEGNNYGKKEFDCLLYTSRVPASTAKPQ